MYFVHPQIKFNLKNILRVKLSFFKKPDQEKIKKLKERFPNKQIYFTDMGRSAFRLIIEEYNLKNSEIIMPAYICDIFMPILNAYNIEPKIVDVDKKTFNIDPEKIKENLNKNTKAILVSHTYGLPADIKRIREIIKNSNYDPLIIEDVAHGLGGKLNHKYLGSLGDVSFFSLYKVLPTLRGGMALMKNGEKINLEKTRFSPRDILSFLNTLKFFSFLFKKFAGKVATKHIRDEKMKNPGGINKFSLNMFLRESENLDKIIEKRKVLGKYYFQKLQELGFETQPSENHHFTFVSALVPEDIDRNRFVETLRKYHVFSTRIWRRNMILPKNPKEFKNANKIAKSVVNFPLQNFYSKKQIDKIIKKTELALKDLKK